MDLNRIFMDDISGNTLAESSKKESFLTHKNKLLGDVLISEKLNSEFAIEKNKQDNSLIDRINAKLPNPTSTAKENIDNSRINTEEAVVFYRDNLMVDIEAGDVSKDISIDDSYSIHSKKSLISSIENTDAESQAALLSKFSQENINDISEDNLLLGDITGDALKKKYSNSKNKDKPSGKRNKSGSSNSGGVNGSGSDNERAYSDSEITAESPVNTKNTVDYKMDLDKLLGLMADSASYTDIQDIKETQAETIAKFNKDNKPSAEGKSKSDLKKSTEKINIPKNVDKKNEVNKANSDIYQKSVKYSSTDLMSNMYDVYFIPQDKNRSINIFTGIKSYDSIARDEVLKLLTSPVILSSRIKRITVPALLKGQEEKTLFNVTLARENGSVSGENKSSITFTSDFGFYLVDLFNQLSNTHFSRMFDITLSDENDFTKNLSKLLLANVSNIFRYCNKTKASFNDQIKGKFDIVINLTPHSMYYNDYSNNHEYQMFVFKDCKFIGSSNDIVFDTNSDGGIMDFTYDFIYKRLITVRGISNSLTPNKNLENFKKWKDIDLGRQYYDDLVKKSLTKN